LVSSYYISYLYLLYFNPVSMKLLLLISIILSSTLIFGQNENPNYNDSLAKLYESDDYGMKSYFFVLLKSGKNTSTDKVFLNKCFSAHMENINNLVKQGKLIVAGPFGNNEDDMRGLFIINAKTIEEVNTLLINDTAIQEDVLSAHIYPWYGSAALPSYLEDSDKIWKKSH